MPTKKTLRRKTADLTTTEADRRKAVVDLARDLYRAEMTSAGKWLARSSGDRRQLAKSCLDAADDFVTTLETYAEFLTS